MTYCKEDNNVTGYASIGMLEIDLIRRARAVMGFRGKIAAENAMIDHNAMQHSLRMLGRGRSMQPGPNEINLREFDVAQYAVHIANETMYWDDSSLYVAQRNSF